MSALAVVEPLVELPAPKVPKRHGGEKRGSSYDRTRRRAWLVEAYRADVDVVRVCWIDGEVSTFYPTDRAMLEAWAALDADVLTIGVELLPAARCYRCGHLLTVEDVTVDRIVPGCKGGTYRRNNIRPACDACNSETGGKLGAAQLAAKRGHR